MYLKALMTLLLMSQLSFAADYSIFEVRKSLPMENNETAYKDYYINAGVESGMKKGMYLNVIRNSTVLDPAKNAMQGSLKIPIGKLQIIQVDKHISVGRLTTTTSNDERPSVEFEGFMIGDVLDMESASMEAPIQKAKRKTASADEDSDSEAPVVKAVVAAPKLAPVAVEVKTTVEAKPAATSVAPQMVKVPVPPPQSSANPTKKTENIL